MFIYLLTGRAQTHTHTPHMPTHHFHHTTPHTRTHCAAAAHTARALHAHAPHAACAHLTTPPFCTRATPLPRARRARNAAHHCTRTPAPRTCLPCYRRTCCALTCLPRCHPARRAIVAAYLPALLTTSVEPPQPRGVWISDAATTHLPLPTSPTYLYLCAARLHHATVYHTSHTRDDARGRTHAPAFTLPRYAGFHAGYAALTTVRAHFYRLPRADEHAHAPFTHTGALPLHLIAAAPHTPAYSLG